MQNPKSTYIFGVGEECSLILFLGEEPLLNGKVLN